MASAPVSEQSQPLLDSKPDDLIDDVSYASFLVLDAMRGVVRKDYPETIAALKLWRLHRKLVPLFTATALAFAALSAFETPLWCTDKYPNPCRSPDGSNLYLSGIQYFTRPQGYILEACFIFLLLADSSFKLKIHGWKNILYETRAVLALLAVASADLLLAMLLDPHSFRLSPYVRLGLVIFFSPMLEDSMTNTIAALPKFAKFYLVIGSIIVVGAWMGKLMYGHLDDLGNFKSMKGALHAMYYITSRNDFPVQFMGIYPKQRSSAIFFTIFSLLTAFLFTNLLIAIIYESYKDSSDRKLEKAKENRHDAMGRAFQRLGHGDEDIPQSTCLELINDMNTGSSYHVDTQVAAEYMRKLDVDGDGMISESEFQELCDVLQSSFTLKVDYTTWMERHFPSVHDTAAWQAVSTMVRNAWFERMVELLLLLNLGMMVYEENTELFTTNPKLWKIFWWIDLSFSVAYLVECVLKMMVLPWDIFWGRLRNRFDLVVTLFLLVAQIYAMLFTAMDINTIKNLLVLRLFRLAVLVTKFRFFEELGYVMFKMTPVFIDTLSLFAAIEYLFAIAACQYFGGLIYEGNPKLKDSPFQSEDYYANNFNDFAISLFTLFIPSMVNYTPILSSSFSAVTSNIAGYGFFILYHIVIVQIVTSVFVAALIEEFIKTYDDIEAEAKATGEKQRLEDVALDEHEHESLTPRAKTQ